MIVRDQMTWKSWQTPQSIKAPKGAKPGFINRAQEYETATVEMAAAWADEMEAQMKAGCQLEDVAYDSFGKIQRDATSFQWGVTVLILSEVWQADYAERLRRWFNERVACGSEGEEANDKGQILDPTSLSFDVGDDGRPVSPPKLRPLEKVGCSVVNTLLKAESKADVKISFEIPR